MKPRESNEELTEDEEPVKEGRGRSEKRRAAKSFDALAMELVALPKHRCKGLPVTAALKAALEVTRSTASKPAKRRYLRHLSGLLRESEIEVAAIHAFLAGESYVPVKGDEDYRDLAALREALCEAESYAAAFDEVCATLKYVDVLLVERLAKECQSDRNDKSYRALYKELNRALEEIGLEEETQEND